MLWHKNRINDKYMIEFVGDGAFDVPLQRDYSGLYFCNPLLRDVEAPSPTNVFCVFT